MDNQNQTGTVDTGVSAPQTNANTPATTGVILVPDGGLGTVKYAGVTCRTADDQTIALRAYLRGKILRQFDITEVDGLENGSGKLFVNRLNTQLKLPKVNVNRGGCFTETLPEYFERAKPAIAVWMQRTIWNSQAVTLDAIMGIA